jgi:hypothetical protein
MQSPTTLVCSECGHISDYREFIWVNYLTSSVCQNADACHRRIKQTKIIEEMTNAQHPVDRISRGAVITCGYFLGLIIVMGLAYLWLGF